MCGVDPANANIDTVAIGLQNAEFDVRMKLNGLDGLLDRTEQHIKVCVSGH